MTYPFITMLKKKNNKRALFKPRGIGVVAVLLLLASIKASWGASRIPFPHWLKTKLVAEKMVINGLPSIVYQFSAQKSADAVSAYYQQQWQRDDEGNIPGYTNRKAGYWLILSRIERQRYLLTVQIRSSGSDACTGYLAEADLHRVEKPEENIPMLPGSKVRNNVTSYEAGQKGQTVMITNSASVEDNIQFYRHHYKKNHWNIIMDQGRFDGHALVVQLGNKEVSIVVRKPGDSTMIVINAINR